MPSSEQFASGLNKWTSEDRPKREDFVNDNQTLDAHIANAALKPSAHTEGNVSTLDASGNLRDSLYPDYWLPLPPFAYAGKELPLTWEQIRDKTQAGDFSGIRVGDYKTITLSTSEVVIMEVAGINTYFNYGDTSMDHHIDMISRDCLTAPYAYNATATNSGGYMGSTLRTTLNSTIYNTLPAALRAVIVQKRGLVETKTAADATTYSWQDLGNLWLPTEREVWGQGVWSELKWGAGLAVQYPIFQGSLRHVSKGAGNGGSTRASWWLLSTMGGSATEFCAVQLQGYPRYYSATSNCYVPLCFRIGA